METKTEISFKDIQRKLDDLSIVLRIDLQLVIFGGPEGNFARIQYTNRVTNEVLQTIDAKDGFNLDELVVNYLDSELKRHAVDKICELQDHMEAMKLEVEALKKYL